MSPDEVAQLRSKVDKVLEVATSTDLKVGVLSAEFKAHRESESERAATREMTCPQGPTVRQLVSDVDAIAGTVRANSGRLVKLEQWEADVKGMEAVEEAKADVMWKPFRWLTDRTDRVFWAIVIALLVDIAVKTR